MDQASPTKMRKAEATPLKQPEGWTPEEAQKVIALHPTHSMAEISLAVGKTKGQIAGFIYRARRDGLLKGKRADKVPPPRKAEEYIPKPREQHTRSAPFRKPPEPRLAPVKRKRVRLRLIDSDTAVTFRELEQHHCKWPMGDPRRSDFRFCGCHRLVNSPYCEAHSVTAGRKYDLVAKDSHQ